MTATVIWVLGGREYYALFQVTSLEYHR